MVGAYEKEHRQVDLASLMLKLDGHEGDDAAFREAVTNLIAGTLDAHGLDALTVVRVDN